MFGAITGIGIAIGLAVIEFLWDGWRPHWAVLGKPEGVDGYHDLSRYPDAATVPGLLLFRWDAPLFFANAELFNQRVLTQLQLRPRQSAVSWWPPNRLQASTSLPPMRCRSSTRA